MRVLLADDQPQIRSALRLLLEQELGASVIGEAAEAAGLLAEARAAAPDVILLDWELPFEHCCETNTSTGLRLVQALHEGLPGVKVVALSGRPEARLVAIEAGADAFVSKGDPPEELVAVLRAITTGAGTPTA